MYPIARQAHLTKNVNYGNGKFSFFGITYSDYDDDDDDYNT